uniref:transglycosylase domain-containing protein n=1 Tax=Streptomyces galilaeus TaxID=33899 RepID=UPI0038F6D2F5
FGLRKAAADGARGRAGAAALEGPDPRPLSGAAPFGGNLEGVRAASIAYFGKEPRRLSLAEAALLVALPQSPERRRLDRYP